MNSTMHEAIRKGDRELFLAELIRSISAEPPAERVSITKRDSPPESVEARVEKRATELRRTELFLTKEAAITKAYEEHPEWYAEEADAAARSSLPACGVLGPEPDYTELVKSVVTPESTKIFEELNVALSVFMNRMIDEQHTGLPHGHSAPPVTREQALLLFVGTPAGRKLSDSWLEALRAERQAATAADRATAAGR